MQNNSLSLVCRGTAIVSIIFVVILPSSEVFVKPTWAFVGLAGLAGIVNSVCDKRYVEGWAYLQHFLRDFFLGFAALGLSLFMLYKYW